MSSEILRVGIVAPVQDIDPYGTIDYIGGVVAGQLFQPPYGFVNAGSSIQPVVFGDALRKESDTRWSGSVRRGLKFSDGSEVRASDVVASLMQAWAGDRGVTVSEQGGRVVFEFPDIVSDPHAMLVPSWCAISKGGEGKIGSGAYVLGEGSTATRMRLVRNPHYGGEQGPATIREVHLDCYEPDASGTCGPLLEAIEAGAIDFTQVLGRDDAAGLSRVRKLYQPGSSTAILFLNCERLSRREQRRAIIESVDRYDLARLCYSNPAGFVARGLLPPRMGSFGDGVAPKPADPQLFAGLGKLKLGVIWGPRPYLSKPAAVAERVADQFRRAGLEVEVEMATDANNYFGRLDRGDYDLLLSGWIADSGDPADFLSSLLGSDCVPQVGVVNPAAANLSRWQNEEADRLLARIRLGGDADLTGRLIRLVGDEAPLLPLMYGPSVTVLSRRVRSFEPHPLNIYPLFSELELEG